MSAIAETGPHFEFVLYPNRSFSTQAFVLLMLAFSLVCAGVGVGFFLLGAWPVTGYLGLDVVALFFAFRWVRRESRRVEMIRVAKDGLVVRRIEPTGAAQEVRFEPYWSRISLQAIRGNSSRLTVASHGRACEIGRFLTLQEKRELARALDEALTSFR
jgi:uncharacterized membrane protein